MKALVLAAGKGTRLKPLTNTVPKHLLPVGDKPVLFHVLNYVKEAGIKDIGVVVSPESGPYIEEAIGTGSEWGGQITFIVQAEPLGLAHAVKVAQGFLGDSPFLMLLGDNLVQEGVKDFLNEFHTSNSDASILLREVSDPRAFGVAELDSSGKVIHMAEKPKKPKSNLAIIGVYLFTAEIHKAIAQTKPSWRGELEITDAIQKLLEMGKEIRSHLLRGWWLDIGSNDGLIEANRVVLDAFLKRDIKGEADEQSRIVGRVEIGEATKIENSLVQGPVFIAANCRIKNSLVKPFTNIRAGTVI
ncbi:MAG TPA: glucose-1-phosphate thymidylyltransferase, partial [Dehalococcoidia bacterium]|nr:glucose-1-phosphate thymidylyltransferase [Dehalococcoidia bacterium]